ncbi:MAG: hypothetical protein K2N43_08100, partial [Lachnospiraceae bacterium]|nr:hypothetical protein [Lachnospiraceae bacterium]
MGRRDFIEFDTSKQQNKTVNPVIVFLAFLLGAVTAFAMFWRMRVSKGKDKRGTAVSDDAVDRDYETADREMKQLLRVLRRESERRMWGDPEIRISGDYGVSGVNPANVQAQKVKPYRPRKRVSAKKIFVRATAVAAAVALVVTGLTMAPSDRVPVSTVLAKESFGGIKQVVEEHDEDNPFVILDIVPGKAFAVIDGNRYEFSLGTIGYLAPGQSPIQQDLFRIFTDNKENFYDFDDRIELTDLVISNGYNGISYQEGYGGTGENLKASVWSKIYDPVKNAADGNPYPTGRLWAEVTARTGAAAGSGTLPVKNGYDYNLVSGDGATISTFAMGVPSVGGIYTFAEDQGDYQIIFEGPEKALSGYRAEVIRSGSYDEVVLGGSYSDATGVYVVENGAYRYACTIGEFKGIPRPEPKPDDQDKKPQPKPDDEDDNQGDDNQGDDNQGDDNQGGDDQRGDNEGGDDQSGDNEGGDSQSGDNEGGDSQSGDDQDSDNQPSEQDQPSESQPASEQDSAFRKQSVPEMEGAEGRWYLCVGMEDPEQSEETGEIEESEQPEGDGGSKESGQPEGDGGSKESGQPEGNGESEESGQPEQSEVVFTPEAEEGTYCILKFTYVEEEEEEFLYQIRDVIPVSTGEGDSRPYDSYVSERGLRLNSLSAEAGVDVDALANVPSYTFEYVGGGRGMYKLTRKRSMEKAVMMADDESQDVETQDMDSQDDDAEDGIARAAEVESGKEYYVEVWNAPVYIRCVGGNDWLRRYVFNSLKSQDNASEDFAIRVDTVLAGDVTYDMVQDADLVYLEDGTGRLLDSGAEKNYIYTKEAGNDADGLADISDAVITRLLYEVVEEAKPIIVDYGIVESKDYPG